MNRPLDHVAKRSDLGPTVNVLTWNLERKKPNAPRGLAGIEHLFSQAPDVMVVTETWTGFPARHGHTVWGEALPYDHVHGDERRVVMWSANPWSDVDDTGHPEMPVGRFVAATTETPVGPVRVVGVCIPWHMSNVSIGTKDKRAWEDHLRYLELLEEIIRNTSGPLVVAGDFNQRVPRIQGRYDTAEALSRCFAHLSLHTAGTVAGWDEPLIDHIAASNDLELASVRAWPNDPGGVRISDHAGVGLVLRAG